MGAANILIIVVMVAVLITLVIGVITMMRQAPENRERSNKLMTWRVGLQALAIALVGVMFLMSGA